MGDELTLSVLPQKSDIELWISPEEVELVTDATIRMQYWLWCNTSKLKLLHQLNYSRIDVPVSKNYNRFLVTWELVDDDSLCNTG